LALPSLCAMALHGDSDDPSSVEVLGSLLCKYNQMLYFEFSNETTYLSSR